MNHLGKVLRRIEPALVPVALILVFCVLAWEMTEDPQLAIDHAAAAAAALIPASFAVPLGQALSALPLIGGPLLIAGELLHARRREALLAAGSLGAALAAAEVLKLIFARPRPEWMLAAATNASFPSGHAAAAFALATIAALLWTQADPSCARKAGALFIGAAFLVAAGRIILGVHFASDVIAGAALGTLVSWCMWHLFARPHAAAAPAFGPEQKGHAWSA